MIPRQIAVPAKDDKALLILANYATATSFRLSKDND